MKTVYASVAPYVTKDGSIIRELLHPHQHGNQNQSLAEATLPPGVRTLLHRHHRTEELYHISAGEGLMFLDGEQFAVGPGDTVLIAPGQAHCIEASGDSELRLLCCCSPAYSHEDTELL